MTLQTRICIDCGASFVVTEEEIEDSKADLKPGQHAPSDCPEGLDTYCPFCAPDADGPELCGKCRPKQDGQRA